VSPQTNANRNGLSATAQDGSTVEVRAAQVQATTARVDQFVLQIEWARGDEGGRSNCTVAVNVTPSATP
jgi:hypothetical protein